MKQIAGFSITKFGRVFVATLALTASHLKSIEPPNHK
jgi:hypothetical protein